jgi:hypothetical protein
MRGRGSQRCAGSRRTDRSHHGFGAAEAGLRSGVPGQGLEPRPPRSERGVLPVRRSRNAPRPPSTPDTRGRRSGTAAPVSLELWHGRLAPNDVFYAARLLFDPGSPYAASYVEEHWSPALLRFPTNAQAKAELNSALNYLARKAQRNLSLSGGASIVIRASQAGHHPLVLVGFRCKNDEGDPLGSPSLKLVCGQNASSHTSR